MADNFYDYEYFCGANIFLLADDQPLMEAAGISYTEMDSMQPVYGYCSRLFDAVAPGQKIIQGSIVINLVDPDYLFESITRGRRASSSPTPPSPFVPKLDQNDNAAMAAFNVGDVWRNTVGIDGEGLSRTGYASPAVGGVSGGTFAGVTTALESQYWGQGDELVRPRPSRRSPRMTDPSLLGPTNIEIQFANEFSIMLYSCFFVSKSSAIQIDENVILEEHTFFARASSSHDL
tara:strand:- start:28647 stop:29345 length:699 start_codon:yes stop_codon:yes gene_type:complete